MPFGNQYGIDLGAIYSTANALQNAGQQQQLNAFALKRAQQQDDVQNAFYQNGADLLSDDPTKSQAALTNIASKDPQTALALQTKIHEQAKQHAADLGQALSALKGVPVEQRPQVWQGMNSRFASMGLKLPPVTDFSDQNIDIGIKSVQSVPDQLAQQNSDRTFKAGRSDAQATQAARTATAAETVRHNKATEADSAGAQLTPDSVPYVAQQYRLTGQLPPLGMGKAGASMRSAIISEAARQDAALGRDGVDAVASHAEYKGSLAGEATLGRREANASMAVNELQNLIPTAKETFSTVFRTGNVPIDTVIQAIQNGTNDPQLAKAAVAVNDVINAHARAINPNGEVTDAGRAAGFKLLSTVKNQAAFNAALDQMQYGAGQALKSPGQSRGQLHQTIVGGRNASSEASAPAAGVLHYDAQGNRIP